MSDSKERRLRAWLRSYKIYFETLSASVLTVGAVIVSIQANSIASVQAKLAERQTTAAERALKPFVFPALVYRQTADGVFSDELLEIRNAGGPLWELSVNCAPFLEVVLSGPRVWHPDTAWIAYNGHYAVTQLHGAPTGLLATCEGVENNNRLVELERNFVLDRAKHMSTGSLTLRRIVRIVYSDQFGEKNTEYHSLESSTSRRLDKAEGDSLFNMWNQLYRDGRVVSAFDTTPEEIVKTVRAGIEAD